MRRRPVKFSRDMPAWAPYLGVVVFFAILLAGTLLIAYLTPLT